MNNREGKEKVNKNQFRAMIEKRTEKLEKEKKVVSEEELAEKAARYDSFLKAKELRKRLKIKH
jgi:hypothetical protein